MTGDIVCITLIVLGTVVCGYCCVRASRPGEEFMGFLAIYAGGFPILGLLFLWLRVFGAGH